MLTQQKWKLAQGRLPKKTWITPALLCSINNKNRLYKKFLKCPSTVNQTKFKQCRNILTNLLKDAKRTYYQRSFEVNKGNAKNTWKLLNEDTNRPKTTRYEPPLAFLDNNGKACTERGIAEGFNNFFPSIGLRLEEEIPSQTVTPLSFYLNLLFMTLRSL